MVRFHWVRDHDKPKTGAHVGPYTRGKDSVSSSAAEFSSFKGNRPEGKKSSGIFGKFSSRLNAAKEQRAKERGIKAAAVYAAKQKLAKENADLDKKKIEEEAENEARFGKHYKTKGALRGGLAAFGGAVIKGGKYAATQYKASNKPVRRRSRKRAG